MFDSENKNSRQVDQLYNYTPEFLAERMSLVLLRVLQDQWRLFYIQQRRKNPQKIKSLPQERDHGIVTRIQVIQRKQDEFLLVLQPPARIVLVLLLLQQHSLLMIRKKFGNRRQSKCGVTGWRDWKSTWSHHGMLWLKRGRTLSQKVICFWREFKLTLNIHIERFSLLTTYWHKGVKKIKTY